MHHSRTRVCGGESGRVVAGGDAGRRAGGSLSFGDAAVASLTRTGDEVLEREAAGTRIFLKKTCFL